MKKHKKHLTLGQRYKIEAYNKAGWTQKQIAEDLQVHKSTICRELKRHQRKQGSYSAKFAQELADEKKDRYTYNRAFTHSVEKRVRHYLEQEQWSPEQIVGYCKSEKIEMVCVERIYQYIRADKAKGGKLYTFLRHRLKHRKRGLYQASKVRIKDRVSIEERSAKINNREEFGHWEADLIEGKNHQGYLLTLTERVSKHLLISYLPKGKNAQGVAQAMINLLLPYKEQALSITMDNGMEFSAHKKVAERLETKTFFTHPYSSWEKGQIENMNKLLRQYYPKNEPITKENTQNIREIQIRMNRRPRKNLNYKRPFQIFFNFVNKKVAFAC